ncbi:DsbA family protein [Sphingomonas sp. BN140010]|uniref:DsbA family protein n=1 Tax=Sphingomonas arvum TaxID=2992113 RepID=A0ABT3JHD7_9SPHN|nr:DsbA family protein [Sphingomonas sp. BN140010]MCW3798191.1 DsbA family protein [Sphingomonas sp. BN140010]
MILTLFATAATVSMPVAATPTGWVIGSPKARQSLVEYGSLNCGHCAAFSREATPTLMAAVKAGRLRFEYRPFLIFPHDIAATLIARCVPVSRRFKFVEQYYANTATFTEKLRTADEATLNAAKAKGEGDYNRAVVSATGMKPLAARFGLTGAAVDRCVADPTGTAWLDSAYQKAQAAGISGTPTFFLNGTRVQFGSLEEVKAALK